MRFGVRFGMIVAGLAMGCSANVVDEGDLAGRTGATTQGEVTIERTFARASSGSTVRSRVSAQFMRVSGSVDSATAVRIVSGPRAELAMRELGCAWWHDEPETLSVTGLDGAIELVDVGDIVVRAAGELLPLAVRAFPDVGELVSGVVYTSRDDTTVLPTGTTYSIETSGSAFVDGFMVQVEAPQAPLNVTLAGRRVGDEVAVVASQTDLELRWDVDAASDDDRLLIGLVALDGEAPPLVCVFPDTGAAVIPAQFVGFAEGSDLDFTVHRKRRRIMNPAGIDRAVVDFDFAMTARVTIVH